MTLSLRDLIFTLDERLGGQKAVNSFPQVNWAALAKAIQEQSDYLRNHSECEILGLSFTLQDLAAVWRQINAQRCGIEQFTRPKLLRVLGSLYLSPASAPKVPENPSI